MAIYAMSEILKFVLDWEESILRSYHSISKVFLSDAGVANLMHILQKDQNRLLESLRMLDIKNIQHVEFLKNVRNYPIDPPVRVVDVTEGASVFEILTDVMDVHEDLLKEYRHLKDLAQYERSKDVIDILIDLKLSQIKKISSYMESFRSSAL